MSKDIETIEEVLKHFAPDHWAILDLGQALQQIEKIIKERVIGKNGKRFKAEFPSAFTSSATVEGYDREVSQRNSLRKSQRQALTNALYGKGE